MQVSIVKLMLLSILIIIAISFVFSRILHDEENKFVRRIVAAIAALISLMVLFVTSLSPLALMLVMKYLFPSSLPTDHWIEVLYVSLITVAGLFMYEITVEKFLLAFLKIKRIDTSLTLVLRAILTFFLILWGSEWLVNAEWSRSAILVLSGLNTLVDYLIDKLTKSDDN
jgi:hypothetical protein